MKHMLHSVLKPHIVLKALLYLSVSIFAVIERSRVCCIKKSINFNFIASGTFTPSASGSGAGLLLAMPDIKQD